MGVSAAQGSAGLKPGVCTSTTRPSNPFEGQMIYETDTDLTYIYGGTAWQQVSGGTAVGNSGLVYVTSATIGSGVSSVTVSSCFSATYDAYKIVVTNGTPSANGFIKMTLGSSVTGYYQARNGLDYSTGGRSDGTDNNTAAWTAVGSSVTNGLAGEITLINPFLAKYTLTMSAYSSSTGAANVTGVHQVASSMTGFTVSPSTGTWTGGTIVVYGYRLG